MISHMHTDPGRAYLLCEMPGECLYERPPEKGNVTQLVDTSCSTAPLRRLFSRISAPALSHGYASPIRRRGRRTTYKSAPSRVLTNWSEDAHTLR